jgi:putative polyhydroxyalkanoate system protein
MPPDIQIKRSHSLTPEELKAKIQPLILETAKNYGLKYHWIGNNCKFEGQASGNLIINENIIQLNAKLTFAAKMFKGMIEKNINDMVEKALA